MRRSTRPDPPLESRSAASPKVIPSSFIVLYPAEGDPAGGDQAEEDAEAESRVDRDAAEARQSWADR